MADILPDLKAWASTSLTSLRPQAPSLSDSGAAKYGTRVAIALTYREALCPSPLNHVLTIATKSYTPRSQQNTTRAIRRSDNS